jgi:hypothetical protein
VNFSNKKNRIISLKDNTVSISRLKGITFVDPKREILTKKLILGISCLILFYFPHLDKQKSSSRYKTKNAPLSGSINFFAERMGLPSLIPKRETHKEINARHFMPDPFLFSTLRQTKKFVTL